MLLRLLRSNQPLAYLIIPFFAGIWWFGNFIHPQAPVTDPATSLPLFALLNRIAGNNALATELIALILIGLSAYLLSWLNNKHIFIQERTLMPPLFFILLSTTLPYLRILNPVHCALPFILLSIDRIIGTYRVDSLSYKPFESSLLIGLASLFYGPSAFLLTLVWIGQLLFRPALWREWFFSLAGFIVPFIFLWGIFLLQDQSFSSFTDQFFRTIALPGREASTGREFLFLGTGLFLVILSSHVMAGKFQSKKIIARRSFTLFFWFFVLLVAGYFFIPGAGTELVILAAVPTAYLFTHFFLFVKKRWWGEVLLWLFLIVMILVNFYL